MDPVSVLVLADPAEPQMALLNELGGAAEVAVCNTPAECQETAARAEAILNWRSDSALLQQIWPLIRRLRWVQSRSAGLDGLLFRELVESPVTLTNARGLYSDILGEFAIGAVLFFAKGFRRLVLSQMAGKWEPFDVIEVRGQTLGLVGYGDIGRAVARLAHAFGMNVVALRRRPELSHDDPYVSKVFPPEGKQTMLARSDYVVVTAPLTSETRGLIAAPEFDVMQASAVLINIGRGPVVDEQALVDALRGRRIRGAALDVFLNEPLPAGHPFYTLDNVLLSPHSADQTSDWKERAMRLFLENFRRYHSGEPLLNVVNKKLGY